MNRRKEDAGEQSDRAQGKGGCRCRMIELRELGFGHFMLEINAMCG